MSPSKLLSTVALATFAVGLAGAAWAQQGAPEAGATAEEVVQKVNEAAQYLSQAGEAGLEKFRSRDSEYMWKDTYVFVINCEADEILANPAFPERQGEQIKAHTDAQGKPYGRELCEKAEQPRGGWVEYVWPKPGEQEPSRKVSYVRTVEGTPYQVGAGIYDGEATVEELERISRGQM